MYQCLKNSFAEAARPFGRRGAIETSLAVFALGALLAPGLPSAGRAQSLADRLKGVQSGHEGSASKVKLPAWKPVSGATSKMEIPLTPGLTVVTAVNDTTGDYESIKVMQTVSAAKLVLAYSADKPVAKGAKPLTVHGTRTIDGADLDGATGYSEYFANAAEHFPGTTAISTSTAVLNDLRAGKTVQFEFGAPSLGIMGMVIPMPGADKSVTRNKNGQSMYSCSLKRVESTDLSAPVLVNDVRVELPALHAMCMAGDDEAHFYFLDQASHPITLAFVLGTEDASLQAIKITFPPPAAAKAAGGGGSGGGGAGGGGGGGGMEKALAEKKPDEVYGIYFDFNSDHIKPESEAVLKEISDILHKNPDWKLSVGGHTDNIGGDAFNMDLSNRRAAAVKSALVTQYGIAANRLDPSGYGASRPIETNATMEGRARNRRVELQRE
jgi:outer membrane protein OmpA-like peptidoglycan-associated protein